jgi:hypothetical protein
MEAAFPTEMLVANSRQPEDVGSMFLRNGGINILDYTVLQPDNGGNIIFV